MNNAWCVDIYSQGLLLWVGWVWCCGGCVDTRAWSVLTQWSLSLVLAVSFIPWTLLITHPSLEVSWLCPFGQGSGRATQGQLLGTPESVLGISKALSGARVAGQVLARSESRGIFWSVVVSWRGPIDVYLQSAVRMREEVPRNEPG